MASLVVATALISATAFGQAPNLGTASGFLFFTTAGAVANIGISTMTGDAGSDVGDITGLSDLNGSIYNADPVTQQAAVDVQAAYDELIATPAAAIHSVSFGNGETIVAGAYYTLAETSLNGTLVLDAQDNPNAVFIFKIGGALTVGAGAAISLIHGAAAANIFWVTEGAVSIGAMTTTSGTFLANNGALNVGDGSILEGRLLSTGGAIGVSNSQLFIPSPVVLALGTGKLSGKCVNGSLEFKWATSGSKDVIFSVQGSIDGLQWNDLDINNIIFSNFSLREPTLIYRSANDLQIFYRLVQTGQAGRTQYGYPIRLQPCASSVDEGVVLYPNPSSGQFRILFSGRSDEVCRVSVFNFQGKRIYSANGIPTSIDLSRQYPGVYEVSIQSHFLSVHRKVILTRK